MADFILSGVDQYGLEDVSLSLHGGEPLMVGRDHFAAICDILVERLAGRVRLSLDMQTNGMLIDDEWIELIAKYGIGVGVSLDGPREINDLVRIDKSGKGTHRRAEEGLARLQAAAARGKVREPALICVLSAASDADELFGYFFRRLGAHSVIFRQPIIDWESRDDALLDHLERFYLRLVQLWIEADDPAIRIVGFGKMLGSILTADDGKVELVSDTPVLMVRSDGVVTPHDGITAKSHAYQDTGLVVGRCTLKEALSADFWPAIHAGYRLPEGECRRCKWAIMCRGGELENRYRADAAFSRKSVYCRVNQSVAEAFYDYARAAVGPEILDNRLETRRDLLVGSSLRE